MNMVEDFSFELESQVIETAFEALVAPGSLRASAKLLSSQGPMLSPSREPSRRPAGGAEGAGRGSRHQGAEVVTSARRAPPGDVIP